jgi:hypothetical protein
MNHRPQPSTMEHSVLGGVGVSNEHEATLLIRHLPEAIPLDTLSRLFSHYGASAVRPCTHSRYLPSQNTIPYHTYDLILCCVVTLLNYFQLI